MKLLDDNIKDLTDEQKKELQIDLSSLSDRLDPVHVQKQDVIDSFTKVMDELGDMMNEGIDPEAMIMTDEAFRRRIQTEEHGSIEPVMSQEEMAERAMQGVETLLSGLGLDGKEDRRKEDYGSRLPEVRLYFLHRQEWRGHHS